MHAVPNAYCVTRTIMCRMCRTSFSAKDPPKEHTKHILRRQNGAWRGHLWDIASDGSSAIPPILDPLILLIMATGLIRSLPKASNMDLGQQKGQLRPMVF